MSQIPQELTARKQWLCWKYQHVKGEQKPRKMPLYANGSRRRGANGSPGDIAQLVDYNEAITAAKKIGATGVGFALLKDNGITALDFDNCVIDGAVNPIVENLISSTYAEISPSQKGVRAFFLGDLNNGKDLKGPFGFEVFSNSGFVTVTGDVLPMCSILGTDETLAPITDDLIKYCETRFNRSQTLADDDDPLSVLEPIVGLEQSKIEEILSVLNPSMSYPDWINVGMAVHHETDGEGFDLWNEWSSTAHNYPTSEVLQSHWDSFGRNQGKQPVTARLLLKLAKDAGFSVNSDTASESDFSEINDDDTGESVRSRFSVIDAAKFSVGKPTPWLIKGVIPQADLGVIYGESGSGKSFFISDMALSIARGIEWRGCKTKQCRVVYIAAEGGGGFRKRLKAYEIHNGMTLDDVPFGVIHAAPNMLQKTEALDVAKAIKKWGGADLIIVDTFAQVTPGGNENSGEHVGRALAHCKGLNKALGAMVMLVHHSGKDTSKGARGWSGLRAAADVEIEVVKTRSGRAARVAKQKDGDDNGEWGFDLEVVHVGMDEDGDVIDSCAVVITEVPGDLHAGPSKSKSRMGESVGRWERLVIEVISEFALAQNAGIEFDAVVAEAVARAAAPTNGKRDTRKQHVKRALTELCEDVNTSYVLGEDNCIEVRR